MEELSEAQTSCPCRTWGSSNLEGTPGRTPAHLEDQDHRAGHGDGEAGGEGKARTSVS